jgi:uncharacterized glyoxalase superfamily protein PhnB
VSGVTPIPDGVPQLTPHIVVKDAARAIELYGRALGARQLYRCTSPDGSRVLFAELMLGEARVFVVDEMPEQGALGPAARGGTSVALHLFVEDVDGVVARAAQAGMSVEIPLADCFWGERYALLKDPFGHLWGLASRREDLSPSEIQRRANDFYGHYRS